MRIGRFGLTLVGLVLLGFLIAEGLFQWMLYSDWAIAGLWQKPWLYADYYRDDDYWILYDRMHRPDPRPKKGHPMLGWLPPRINSGTYEHEDKSRIGTRRPLLLYGDSFAEAWPSNQLTKNSAFAQRWRLLNYGVGGYGLDQIYLLYKNSVSHYDSPVVLISFLLEDIDRCILSVRDYAKPYFMVSGDNGLELKGVPVPADVDSFYRSKSLSIHSYLYAATIHHSWFPERTGRWLTNADAIDDRKKKVASAIILRMVDDLKSRRLPFVFLVFHTVPETYTPDDWRTDFVGDLFKRHQIPHVWMRDILRSKIRQEDYDYRRFIRNKDDWHGNEFWYAPMSQSLVEWLVAGRDN